MTDTSTTGKQAQESCCSPSSSPSVSVEDAVINRYGAGANAREEALCCPVDYDPQYLKVLPDEVLERDYGCGDPSAWVRPGDTVLDLGSGAGKICWIAAQIAGPEGRIIGVDMNTEMLGLAKKHHAAIAERVGHDTVEYRRGMIQDLQLDLDALDRVLAGRPIGDAESWLALRQEEERLRREAPMVPDGSVDLILSNCVLNLVRPEDKAQMFQEMFRVLKVGGRVAISDIVSDELVPEAMQADPELWSGCISGAYEESAFVQAFLDAGFQGVTIEKRDSNPWQTVGGIEFRSMTVTAIKPDQGVRLERGQAVIYKGPFAKVHDDAGNVYCRGERMAVCDRTFRMLGATPYTGRFELLTPADEVGQEDAKPFACGISATRNAREMKGGTSANGADDCCAPSSCC